MQAAPATAGAMLAKAMPTIEFGYPNSVLAKTIPFARVPFLLIENPVSYQTHRIAILFVALFIADTQNQSSF